jgi:outer membrane protein assembly factor BamE (lipoprotein component of BamABCDE complex)
MKRLNLSLALVASTVAALSGCVAPAQPLTDRNSQITQGNVQMNVAVGRTSKAEVLEKFGAPNVTTRDGKGNEIWSYQRAAQISQSSGRNGYWTVILGGQSGAASGFETTSRMITLIIKFDHRDIVSDFNSRESNF